MHSFGFIHRNHRPENATEARTNGRPKRTGARRRAMERTGPERDAEREFPALLVVWAYEQKQLIFGLGELIFARSKREKKCLVFFSPFGKCRSVYLVATHPPGR